jgi:hypothetical protein
MRGWRNKNFTSEEYGKFEKVVKEYFNKIYGPYEVEKIYEVGKRDGQDEVEKEKEKKIRTKIEPKESEVFNNMVKKVENWQEEEKIEKKLLEGYDQDNEEKYEEAKREYGSMLGLDSVKIRVEKGIIVYVVACGAVEVKKLIKRQEKEKPEVELIGVKRQIGVTRIFIKAEYE